MAFRTYRWALLTGTALLGLAVGPALAQQTKTEAADCKTDAKGAVDPNCAPASKQAAVAKGSTYLTPLVVSGNADAGGVGDPYATPKAVSTVGPDEINQFGGQNLDDVLRTQPGAFTHDNPQNPGLAVNIRGMDSYSRVNMEIDGARQNFRFTGHDAAGMTFVDPAMLGGVDITRGAVDGVGGAGALAGVANFRTLDVDDLIKDGKDYSGFTSITAGTNGDGVSEAAAAAYRVNDTFAVLGAISKRNPWDYDNSEGETVQNTAQDIISGLVKAEITPTLDSKFTVSGLIYNDNFAANGYQQTVNNQTYSAKYDYTPADNPLVDLHAGIYYNATRMQYTGIEPNSPFTQPPYTLPPYNSIDWLPDVGRVIDDRSWGVNATNTSRGQIGDFGIKSTYGFEYSGDNAEVTNANSLPGVNPSGNATIASVFSATTVSRGIVDLTGGLRYDYYSANGNVPLSDANADPTFSGPASLSIGRLDPSVTLALNPTDWFQPYVSYSQTFRPPTVSELFTGGEHPGGFVVFGANPNLQPETADNWEIGANFRRDDLITAGDSLRLKADYFYSSVDNYITGNLFPTGAMGPFGPVYGSYFVNNPGITHVQGVELQAAYDAGRYFAGLSYTHTTNDLPPTIGLGVVSYTPSDVFTGTIGVRLLEQQNLTLGARLYAVSNTNQGLDSETLEPLAPLPGDNLVDLFANYKFDNGLEIGANVSNVFDVSYSPSLSTTPDLDPAGGTGRGRTFEFTAKASF